MSEKVGRLGRGLQRVEVSSYGRENSQESNVLSDFFFFFFCFVLFFFFFFHYQKRDMTF